MVVKTLFEAKYSIENISWGMLAIIVLEIIEVGQLSPLMMVCGFTSFSPTVQICLFVPVVGKPRANNERVRIIPAKYLFYINTYSIGIEARWTNGKLDSR